ncbi:hypothetical protein BDF22DRAFT_776430 [Syncephalis plumigaleata]|nr:hypothetical protein BDF22DRAFT_776430 [Syncephalis plumigaleata]
MDRPLFHLRPLIAGLQLESSVAPRPSTSEGSIQRRLGSLSRSPSVNTNLKPTVECAEVWENTIFLGTSDGCIIQVILNERVDISHSGHSSDDTMALPRSQIVQRCNVGSNRRIERLVALPHLRKLVVFCDSALSFYSLPNLTVFPSEVISTLKGITCFYIDPPPPSSASPRNTVRICVAKRRSIQLYRLSMDLVMVKEFTLSDSVSILCMAGNSICFADNNDYFLMDMERGEVVPIMPITQSASRDTSNRSLSGTTKPIITSINDAEYLLTSAATSTYILYNYNYNYYLGIFISSSGEPTRGTLEWPSYPRSIVYNSPYIITLLRNNTITVHQMDQQRLIQTIDVKQPQPRSLLFSPGMIMSHTNLARKLARPDRDATDAASTCERLFFVGPDIVTALVTESIIEQVDHYLDSNRIEEGIVLLEHHLASRETDGLDKSMGLLYIYRKAGLICLGETLFDDALGYFRKGELDPRLLVNFFPNLSLRYYHLPMEQDIQQQVQLLQNIHHIVEKQLAAFNSAGDKMLEKTYISNAYEMLLRYLKLCKESGGVPAGEFTEDLDTLLLRLYTELDPAGLLRLLREDNNCQVEACEQWLKERDQHYALSLLYKSQHRLYDAMVLWQSIANGELVDPSFGGLQEFTDTLLASKDASLLQTFTPWILSKDTSMGIKMLCQLQAMPDGPLSDQSMLSMVRQYGMTGLVDFLEHLVLVRRTTDPIHHDALADIYIERLGELCTLEYQEELLNTFKQAQSTDEKLYFAAFLHKQTTPQAQMRTRLLQFLETSTLYNPETVLKSLSRIDLYSIEACVVLAKLDRFEESLRLLVDKLDDCVGAELFCHCGGTFSLQSDGIVITRDNQLMFTTLLNIYLQQSPPQQEVNVTRLLTCFSQSLDAIETLHSIPDYWSADIMTGFLIQAIRKSTGTSRELQLLRALAHTELNKATIDYATRISAVGGVLVTESTLCRTCKKPLTGALSGCRLRRGKVMEVEHVHCLSNE